jgi:cellulose 1,4-beta-cellobiosidase
VEVPTGFAPAPIENYDVAYDIWFNQTSAVLPAQNGQPNGTEVMIWINHNGTPIPNGSKIASNVSIANSTWDVWVGTEGTTTTWNIVTYVQNTPTSSVKNLDLTQFFNDAQTRQTSGGVKVLNPSWYLIDVEMGFEVWDGGQGLEISNFTVSTTSQ